MRRRIVQITLYMLLAFFTILMVRITLPHFTFNPEEGFLQIKQHVMHIGVWRAAFYAHVLTSLVLVFAGFTQFLPAGRFRKLHRGMGKAYIIVLLCISGPAGLIMGVFANGGITSQLAFVLLALLWLYTTWRAYTAIRKGDIARHRKFMIRSFALTLSALTLRAWKFLIVFAFAPPPMDVYRIVAWLGWVPNLLIAEWMIRAGIKSGSKEHQPETM
ncbi:MAG: DUF2306 domain-containing protein [Bacteroidetes bacterium]|nr:DUF2306 domain-containing protein [Bacteroidota bacterium]